MAKNFLKGIFGTANDRFLKSLKPNVQSINALEEKIKTYSDEDLRRHTFVFKEKLERGESLDQILNEVFAVVREAAFRSVGMRPYDVQLIGGMILHSGKIAEMKTGEGKTLVATLPAYLNALTGKGVHIVTVNDYLAKRDAEWMGQVFRFLGMEVGCVYSGMNEQQKKRAYEADITYGQNNEFGFDYLRDNLKFSSKQLVQRGHHYAIVDEVDSILIDEARTPLIISGPAEDSSDLYLKVNKIIPKLKGETDYEVDLQSKQPTLTEEGVAHAEKLLEIDNLYDPSNIDVLHHVNQSLKAITVMQNDVDYVVRDKQVIIVDEFTGRLMSGRRWSDGLHQAVEAKEGVPIARENRTLASITFQNLFRMYNKLSGMTGTAVTEATEFKSIYNLEVTVIPTNLPLARHDMPDMVYRTQAEKYNAVVEEIEEVNKSGQPILVGTTNIEQSELVSKILTQKQVPHHVLNAKHHEQEAQIVSNAGRLGALTIATNMAGRGTDIVLGGNPEAIAGEVAAKDSEEYSSVLAEQKQSCAEEKEKVLAAGGLYIVGTARHESRRIDNQLRGRAGRQGDPGKSVFFISLEDDLMKRFGGDKHVDLMKKMGWREGMAIDSRVISRRIEAAQSRVERFHFEGRKQVTEYDDVLNKQRQVIYHLRNKALEGDNLKGDILEMVDDLIEDVVVACCPEEQKPGLWKVDDLKERYQFLFNAEIGIPESAYGDQQAIFDLLRNSAKDLYSNVVAEQQGIMDSDSDVRENIDISLTPQGDAFDYKFSTVERETILETLDHYWNVHLQEMEFLREGIGLRGYGQKNPLQEYQREGFEIFTGMLDRIKEEVLRKLYYFDGSQFRKIVEKFVREQKRRAEIERQMELAGQEEESKSKDKALGFQPKDPDEVRAKMQERKKKRRKRR